MSSGVLDPNVLIFVQKSPVFSGSRSFSYPEPFLRAVNGARQGALAKSISNWHLIGYNEGYCSNNVYILLPCFYGIRFWIWPEPLVAPRVRRALGTRMVRDCLALCSQPRPQAPTQTRRVPTQAVHGSGAWQKLQKKVYRIWKKVIGFENQNFVDNFDQT